MLYPLTFHPIFKERVWGGRRIEELFGKRIDSDQPIGESWEITDRPEGVSVIANGPLAGKDLRWLMAEHREALMGTAKDQNGRFPLLVKILDAQDKLSLQVHPPADKAAALGGEPKTEMWHVVHAEPGAELYVGLKRGVDRATLEQKINDGSVAECFHRIEVQSGDVMFLPSGRVHAIGAGLVIFEIQQNSDTTYRVFDWNRAGLDGKPRELQVRESLESIHFEDFEPGLVKPRFMEEGPLQRKRLVEDALFRVDLCELRPGSEAGLSADAPLVIGVVEGDLAVRFQRQKTALSAGQFCLIPASCRDVTLEASPNVKFLKAVPG